MAKLERAVDIGAAGVTSKVSASKMSQVAKSIEPSYPPQIKIFVSRTWIKALPWPERPEDIVATEVQPAVDSL